MQRQLSLGFCWCHSCLPCASSCIHPHRVPRLFHPGQMGHQISVGCGSSGLARAFRDNISEPQVLWIPKGDHGHWSTRDQVPALPRLMCSVVASLIVLPVCFLACPTSLPVVGEMGFCGDGVKWMFRQPFCPCIAFLSRNFGHLGNQLHKAFVHGGDLDGQGICPVCCVDAMRAPPQ